MMNIISDACLRCQSENKQDDCVGMYFMPIGNYTF